MTTASALTKPAQLRVARRSPAYWRVTIDNPPINVMGPEMVKQFQEVINALEADEQVRVVVFDSAVDDYFLNHSDFLAKLEDLTAMPAGPTGLPPWPDFLVRLTRLPVASIALIRGRATGNGSEITLACDMSFASREKAIISQWEVGVGMVAGGGPMARLPQLIGRNRALEVLLSSEDIRAEQAEAYGYINRALPDADLDAFVEALATRIAKFDKWAIAQTKRLVNTSLPPDVELGAGWDACIASLGRPAAQEGIKALIARGFHKPGDVENRLGYYLGQIARQAGARRDSQFPNPAHGIRSKPILADTFRKSAVLFYISCTKEVCMSQKAGGAKPAQQSGIRAHQPGQEVFKAILSEDIDWKPFPAFPPSVRLAVVVGQPSEPSPYTIRVKTPHGEKLMPHKHPEDRVYTVISGVFYIGLGDEFDASKLEAYPPGAVIILPGNTPHFHWAKSGEYITQITAMGPLGLEYLSARDDPRVSR
jgi:enoyl-CoA hydratase/carnithine racemase/quercetin dioxygenase-like cupin family protein